MKKNYPGAETNYKSRKVFLFLLLTLINNLLFAQIWNPLSTNSVESLKAVYFIDNQTGWVCGTNGAILKTTDGGTNWINQSISITQAFRCIHFTNSSTGWVAGDQGIIYKTTNGGSTWTPQNSNSGQQLNAIKFLDNMNGFMVGSGTTIRKTIDGGTNWTTISAGSVNSNLWGLSLLDAQNFWVSGSSKRIAKTTNGGTNFTNEAVLPGGAITTYNDIFILNSTNGWAVNSYGNANGNIAYFNGASWTAQNSGVSADLLSVHFLNTNQGWVSGRNGTILSTSNGGINWGAEASGVSTNLWDIQFVNDSTGWCVGDSGIVVKYQKINITSPITLLQPIGGEIYNIGNSHNIIWVVDNSVTNIKIEYSTTNGSSWTTLSNNYSVVTGNGSYTWNVTGPPSTAALVKISKVGNPAIMDLSAANFNILNDPVGKEYAVLLTATSINSPAQININWINDPVASSYSIDRKLKSDSTWTFLSSLSGTANTYADLNVTVGEAFEYRVVKITPQLTGYGYIYAGLELPETDFRGEILILADINFSSTLTNEIKQLELDLIGDGYLVKKQIIDPTIGVAAIKNIITQEYANSGGMLSTVLSIGHLPAPYSGNFAPDGHSERIGAQPADGFYGEIDGNWTDNTVTVVNTGAIYTPNIPGDGNYDQSSFPSLVDLQVGRIDMNKMTGFPLSENNLLAQYLNKNHDFRLGISQPKNRGLINSTFDILLPTTSAAAWRSFSTMFDTNIKEIFGCNAGNPEFIDSLTNENYLWTHMAGGGSDTSMTSDVFTSYKCITRTINTVFMQMYGSYFVEWYKGGISTTTNHLLRAPLASNGTTLASVWSGKAPYWHFHHMSLGETIGYSSLTNQNNFSTYQTSTTSAKGVHMALMGDPTLKQHIVQPVSNVACITNGNSVDISWNPSPDNVVGYNIYRADSLYGMFTKINSGYLTTTSYNDVNPANGNNVYMVRAVKLENTPSGTYYNLSTGMMDSTFIQLGIETNESEISITVLPNPTDGNFYINIQSTKFFPSIMYIQNAIGQIIYENDILITTGKNAIAINLPNLSNGIYAIIIKNETGISSIKKIVINK